MAITPEKLLPLEQIETEMSLSTIFTITFVNPVPRECKCMLCEEAMKQPRHLTCCSASYCKACAERMKAQSLACKECCSLSYAIDADYEDEATERLIQSLQVYCPLKEPGCMWRGELEELENHLQWGEYDPNDIISCRYLQVSCPKNCGKLVPRRDMDVHSHMACKYRMKQCVCGKIDTADSIDTVHASKECVMRVVLCPNNCKMPGLRYKKLSDHMESECLLRMVLCEYESIGCDGWFHHKDSQAHNDGNIQEHLWLMSEKLASMNSTNEELRSSFLYTQSICKKLQEKYDLLLPLLDSGNNDKLETDSRYRVEVTTEVDSEEEDSTTAGTIIVEDGGYAAMGRQDTLKRYQTVFSPSSQSLNTGLLGDRKKSASSNHSRESGGKKPIPLPPHAKASLSVGPMDRKTRAHTFDAFPPRHQAGVSTGMKKAVTTGSMALHRLTISLSHLPNDDSGNDPTEIDDDPGEGYHRYRASPPISSPSYWQSTSFLQQHSQCILPEQDQPVPTEHDQPVPPERHYSYSQDWGVPSDLSSGVASPTTPTSNGGVQGFLKNSAYANFQDSNNSHEVKAQHWKLSKSRSVDNQPISRVRNMAATFDARTRAVSTATPPSLLPKPVSSGHSASDNSIPRILNADNPMYKDFARELEMKLALALVHSGTI